MSFLNELKRRNVFRVGLVYLASAWLIAQVTAILVPAFVWPAWVLRVVIIVLAVGFPIALVIAWLFELTPEGLKRSSEVDAAQSITPITGRKLDRVLIGILALIVVAFAVDRFVLERPAKIPEIASAPVTAPKATDVLPNSVAVLPFENLSPDPKDAYFASGLHQEVIDQISKIHSMSVIARSSVMQYAKETRPVPEVAKELHVGSVMEGSVRFANDRVRVSTQLVDAVTGTNLWSDTYERPLGDVFKIESDIAMNVANALQARFSPEEEAQIEKVPTKSPEAYALFLQAQARARNGDTAGALTLLQQAVSVDPSFAQAYGLMALLQANSLANSIAGAALPADQRAAIQAQSRKNAERAIAIDPNVQFAHAALAVPAWISWRWSEADKAFARALDVAPNDIAARLFYGMLLSWSGHIDKALAITKRATELDPENPFAGGYALHLGYAKQYDAAIDIFERTIAANPRNLVARDWLALLNIARGNPPAAIAQLELSEKLAGNNRVLVYLPEWAYSYGRAGRREDAERIFKEIMAAADKDARPGAGGFAMAYLAIGDEKHALEWLEKVAEKASRHEVDEGMDAALNLRMDVTNDPVLNKPEFVEVLSRIKGD